MLTIDLVEKFEGYILGNLSDSEKLKLEQEINSNVDLSILFEEFKRVIDLLDYKSQKTNLIATLHNVRNKDTNSYIRSGLCVKKRRNRLINFVHKNKAALFTASTLFFVFIVSVWLVSISLSHTSQLTELKRSLSSSIIKLEKKIISNYNPEYAPSSIDGTGSVGTGFVIDNDGYLITNLHNVLNAKNIYVEDTKNNVFETKVVHVDDNLDLAVLKIIDSNFYLQDKIPYKLNSQNADIGEEIFTLGFPKEEVVYSEGYLSSENGFHSDSSSVQISISLNPGNSGGPIFDFNANVIGVVRNKQKKVDGVFFATKSSFILRSIKEFKKQDTANNYKNLDINSNKTIEVSRNKTKKIDKIRHYKNFIYLVRSYY